MDLEEKPLIKVYKTPSYFDDTSTIYRDGTVIVDSNGDTTIDQYWNGPKNQYGDTSYSVSIGSINVKLGDVDGQQLKWFPTIHWSSLQEYITMLNSMNVNSNNTNDTNNESKKDDSPSSIYDVYTLPSDVVLIPFHSLLASNPGHLVWGTYSNRYMWTHAE